jgi:DDE family transposase
MPAECSVESFDFGTVEGRHVEAAFDGGLVTSDAGALLLGATDRAIRMMDRVALCVHDERRPEYIEYEVATWSVNPSSSPFRPGPQFKRDGDELVKPLSQSTRCRVWRRQWIVLGIDNENRQQAGGLLFARVLTDSVM